MKQKNEEPLCVLSECFIGTAQNRSQGLPGLYGKPVAPILSSTFKFGSICYFFFKGGTMFFFSNFIFFTDLGTVLYNFFIMCIKYLLLKINSS